MIKIQGNYGTEYCEIKVPKSPRQMPWLEYDQLAANLHAAESVPLHELPGAMGGWFPIAYASNDKLFLAKALWDVQHPPVIYRLIRIGTNSYQIFRPLGDKKET